MKFYRCDNCKRLITKRIVEKMGQCPKCSGRKLKYAVYYGYNMPNPFEFILLFLGLR